MVLSSNVNDVSSDADSYSGQLLHDIEEISRALYLPKALHLPSEGQSSSGCEFVTQNVLHKDKKLSIWNWKPLKALTHSRDHRFNCCFFLHAHSIEGLPSNFNDLVLCVNWKRKKEELRSHPVRVFQGIAEFEETLMHQCTVYGNGNGPQNSLKYDPILFLLNASVIGAPAIDIGKHWVDLTRLLPLTLEELKEEKRTSGKWTTSFKLKGKAKGATLNVTFGFSVFGDDPFNPSGFVKVSGIKEGSRLTKIDQLADHVQVSNSSGLHRLRSIRRKSADLYHHSSSQSLDMQFLGDVFSDGKPELAQSISLLCQKLAEGKVENSKEFKSVIEHPDHSDSKSAASTGFSYEDTGNELDNTEFTVIDRGIEPSVKDESKVCDSYPILTSSVIETIDIAEVFQDDLSDSDAKLRFNTIHEPLGGTVCLSARNSSTNNDDGHGEQLIPEDLPMVLQNFLASESAELSSSPNKSQSIDQENFLKFKRSCSSGKMIRSLSLDDVMDSVANEFLDMLGTEQFPGDASSDGEPESPRERLLREFEEECFGFSNPILGLDVVAEQMEVSDSSLTGNRRVACADDFDLSLVTQEAEKEQSGITKSLRSRRNTKMLEDLETESLMQQWGLTEKAFQSSPHITSGGFGSPVYLPPEEPYALPPLGEGLGPIIQTKSGGFIQSMNSLVFKGAKNGAKLILQVSKPIVLPVVMGSTVMEILQCWASGGAQKMSVQLKELMPLEDITGKTMQQLITETSAEVLDRFTDHSPSMHENHEESLVQCSKHLKSSSFSDGTLSNYVSLEDLVPLAVAKIEALSIEGLRIQSGLSDVEAPSSTRPEFPSTLASLVENTKFSKTRSPLGVTTLQVSDVKRVNCLDEVIKQSISLDQWVECDSGGIGYDSGTDEWMKTLSAYDAKFYDMDSAQKSLSGGMCGFLGDYFTLAFRLQLRDPFRDYEMVGASMLALVQVERVCLPSNSESFGAELERHHDAEEDDLNEDFIFCGTGEEVNHESLSDTVVPQFKISEVHVAGLNFEPNDKQPLNTSRQLQSGSRWLLSNGMNRMGTKWFSSSNAIIKSSSQMLRKKSGNILWSLSSQVQCATAKLKDVAAFNMHVRNPDIIFSNEPTVGS